MPRKIFLLVIACTLSSLAHAYITCAQIPQLETIFLKRHYSFHQLNDQLKNRTIDQFIKNTDPSKTMFTEEDVNKVKAELTKIFVAGDNIDCGPLDKVATLLIERSKQNETFVKNFLGPTYAVNDAIEIVVDPKKRSFPKTVDERNEMLKKMVHFQIVNLLLSDTKIAEAKKQLIHRYELLTKRMQERKLERQVESFLEGFAQSLDPHSTYLTRDNMEDFQISMRLSLEGIGASLSSQDGFTVVEELIPGGSADRAKSLRTKDRIIAVAQDGAPAISTIDMELREVVKMIRGKKGTKVKLTIMRTTEGNKTFDVTIVRDKIDIKDQAAKITYQERKVGSKKVKFGVIDLPSFYGGSGKEGRTSSKDVQDLLVEAKKNNVAGIVLNVSHNGGGLLDEAVRISGLFLNKGNVVATKDTEAKVDVLADDDTTLVYGGPLVILISRLSASASEILAGSLKDYQRALIVGGDHTFGKGSVQILSPLPLEYGGMKVTTGMFFLPGGASTQHLGVASDIVLPPSFLVDEIGEKTLDYSLPPQNITPFLSVDAKGGAASWNPIDRSVIPVLQEKSQKRVAKDPKFVEMKKKIDEAKKDEKGTIKLAEYRKKSEEENKKQKDKEKKANKSGLAKSRKEAKEKAKELDQPILDEAVNILADWVQAKGAPHARN